MMRNSNTILRSLLFHLNRHPQKKHYYLCHSRYIPSYHVTCSAGATITSAAVVVVLFVSLHNHQLQNRHYNTARVVYSFPYLFSNHHSQTRNNHYNHYQQHRTLLHTLLLTRSISTTLCASQNDNENRPLQITTTETSKTSTNSASTTIKAATTFTIPEPKHRHITLPPLPSSSLPKEGPQRRSGILVIGDVHGCYDEMILLYNKAIVQNNHQAFHYVILVGDICNKGPQSMLVIRHMQEHANWICIRGNHENAVLRAYQEMKVSSSSKESETTNHNYSRYRWLLGEETAVDDMTLKDSTQCSSSDNNTQNLQFTDEDFRWMSNLPYTIRIPANHIGLLHEYNNIPLDDDSNIENSLQSYKNDFVIVHAGLIPGLPIEENDIPTMVVLRDISVPDDDDDVEGTNGTTTATATTRKMKSVPWASVWDGPELILFGHDAKRGLQLRYDRSTIGLDTGCVYGKQLTGMILPSRTIVQVDALKQHVPIIEK